MSVSDLRENTFSFSLLSKMSPVGLSLIDFIMMKCVPSILTLLRVFAVPSGQSLGI